MPPVGSKIFGSSDIWETGPAVLGYDPAPLTSQLYPIDYLENITSIGDVKAVEYGVVNTEELQSSATLLASSLRALLQHYEDWPPEVIGSGAELLASTLKSVLIQYEDWPAELIQSSGSVLDSTLETVLIRYEDWPPELIQSTGAEILGGTLT